MSMSFWLMLATGLAIIILLLYIIGRMGKIEEVTKSILLSKNEISSGSQSVASQNKEDFDDLQGRDLWDTLTGRSSGGDDINLDSIRQRYEIILKKHVQGLLKHGYSDGNEGAVKRKPRNLDEITTLRGSVESWLPSEHCAVLYNSGYELANAHDQSDKDRIRMSVDDSIAALFDAVQLPFPDDFSQGLISSLIEE